MQAMKNEIEKLWKTEQEILDVFHQICNENHLCYSLAYGTLIGAVRHGGFIPWDDDIDIMMPRKDYNTLLKIWSSVAPADYVIQDYNTDPNDYTNNFAKIRKNHTTFLQSEEERSRGYHKGIFIDIFPGDRRAPKGIARLYQYFACAVNLLYSRGYTSGATGAMGIFERFLLRVSKDKQIKRRKQAERVLCKWNENKDAEWFFPCTIGSCKKFYPAGLFEARTTMDFSGNVYYVTSDYDKVLRIEYGDYMQLPPEEERVWKHHPILIDFERNYEEIVGGH